MIDIRAILADEKNFSDGERLLAEWYAAQQGEWGAGGFTKSLFDCMSRADANNVFKLALGFPSEVRAWREWTQSDLKQRFEKVEAK